MVLEQLTKFYFMLYWNEDILLVGKRGCPKSTGGIYAARTCVGYFDYG
jgi:hypothetical protein